MPRDECGCGAKIGHFHRNNCEREECPFCHGQLIACGCAEQFIPDIPETGMTPKQGRAWDKILRKQGLVPYGAETVTSVDQYLRHMPLVQAVRVDDGSIRFFLSVRRPGWLTNFRITELLTEEELRVALLAHTVKRAIGQAAIELAGWPKLVEEGGPIDQLPIARPRDLPPLIDEIEEIPYLDLPPKTAEAKRKGMQYWHTMMWENLTEDLQRAMTHLAADRKNG